MDNISQFVILFATHFCKEHSYDIGFLKEEWKFYANNLPDEVDYVYSSHCL